MQPTAKAVGGKAGNTEPLRGERLQQASLGVDEAYGVIFEHHAVAGCPSFGIIPATRERRCHFRRLVRAGIRL
jgi:hypothetical protein